MLLRSVRCYECDMNAVICETSLVISNRLTMRKPKGMTMYPLSEDSLYPKRGKLYRYDVTNVTTATPVEMNDVISADGWETPRLVVVANGTMPGPTIIVYVGQTVKIHVTNKLKSEQVTIHWHGIPQEGTPYMDGVPFITQCPILTGQTFVYTFQALYKGTYMYHSHSGLQRSKGLFGAFIIREKNPHAMHGMVQMEEHIMTIQEWNHDWDSDMDDAQYVYGPFENRQMNQVNMDPFGLKVHSGLFNGRGRFWNPEKNTHNEAPLETFNVQSRLQYRFRVIASGGEYPWIISVDNHNLSIVATDGYDVVPQVTDSFIINVGERFDFILTADQPLGNYWIRAKSIEALGSHTAEAILHYNGASDDEPTSNPRNCTIDSLCLEVNCYHRYYPDGVFKNCIPIDLLRSQSNSDPAPPVTPGKFQELFMNTGFPGAPTSYGAVNGRSFVFPTETVLTDAENLDLLCEQKECGDQKVCQCTNSVTLNHGNTVQIIFLNIGAVDHVSEQYKMHMHAPHPIHMHGHSFYVLKMGWSTYDSMGMPLVENNDVVCRGRLGREINYCNYVTWSNATWSNGNIPGLELNKPVRKDTIIIPKGGYVVTRIVANNPGVWHVHCHILVHSEDGMAILLNESFSRDPPPPDNFPRCHNFPDIKPTSQQPTVTTVSSFGSEPTVNNFCSKEVNIWVLVGVLCGVILLQFLLSALYIIMSKKGGGNSYKVD